MGHFNYLIVNGQSHFTGKLWAKTLPASTSDKQLATTAFVAAVIAAALAG